MNSENSNQRDPETRGAGFGNPDEPTVIERAAELARIEGRTEANQKDYEQARQDLITTGSMPVSPEAGELEALTSWDTPPESTGRKAPETGGEDEANIGQLLVEEGIEEADHDLRVSTSEELNKEDDV